MRLIWSPDSLADLIRLPDFLEPVDPSAADAVVVSLNVAANRLLEYPRLGERMPRFRRREVRRILVGSYELRYEVQPTAIIVTRLYNTRERR
ncbi:MAG: type II toxin-antitoxin system RelE/ParE family toxin [Chloroflexia bacterium]|nr:type II toxin-antitoxin system RelE/ParE family toxin [Chloroflexia bacterium]